MVANSNAQTQKHETPLTPF